MSWKAFDSLCVVYSLILIMAGFIHYNFDEVMQGVGLASGLLVGLWLLERLSKKCR